MILLKAVDIDGTICRNPSKKLRGEALERAYENAKPKNHELLRRANLIITARHERHRARTLSWLLQNFRRAPHLEMVTQGGGWKSLETVADYKAAVIIDHWVSHYYDDDRKLLCMIRDRTGGTITRCDKYKVWLLRRKLP